MRMSPIRDRLLRKLNALSLSSYLYIESMAELVSIQKFDSPPYNHPQWAVRTLVPRSGEKGKVWSASGANTFDMGAMENALGVRSPERSGFSSRRPPVNVQWRNIELITSKGEYKIC